MKKNWVVRIVLHKQPFKIDQRFQGCGVDLLVTETLRYAGITRVIKDDDNILAFDLMPPKDAGGQMWAEMNARRIASFGINAVAAPVIQ